MTIATIITNISLILTGILGFLGSALHFLISSPIVLFIILIPVVFDVIKTAAKISRLNNSKRYRHKNMFYHKTFSKKNSYTH
jgi:ABC-type transport system involved in cytochrome bd biosynthesis fused ATPase/permease subunit